MYTCSFCDLKVVLFVVQIHGWWLHRTEFGCNEWQWGRWIAVGYMDVWVTMDKIHGL
jgi:hypothetical protein